MARPFLQVSAALLLLVVLSESAPSVGRLSEAEWESYNELDHQGPGTYAFGYDVEDPANGNMQFRQEERHPNGTVTGSYGVVEPDGNVRVVHYIADHMGYRVTIENSRKRYGTSGGNQDNTNSDTQVIYPNIFNHSPPSHLLGKSHIYVQHKPQNTKFYSPTNVPNYANYRKQYITSPPLGLAYK